MDDKKNKRDFGDYVASKDTEPGQREIDENVPEEIIVLYRADKVMQNTALQMLREYYHSQLEASKNRFLKAVMLNKPLTGIDAEKTIEELNRKYFDFLQQLGVDNNKERVELLVQLNRQSSELLAKVDNGNLRNP